jgi:pyridoxamine 5'-phosphate oxidase
MAPEPESEPGSEPGSLRDLLRAGRVFPDQMPDFDPDTAPDDPVTLFRRWLAAAVKDEVPAPQAMTLATADSRGRPSERVLICRDIDTAGRWYFASDAASGKGRDLAVNPHAALTFFWPRHGRQIRVTGAAEPADRAAGEADFLARPPASRAEALHGRQSEPLADLAELDRIFRQSHARVLADPDLVAPGWTVYALTAADVEFWQGDPDRRHVRLRYRREGDGWGRQLLWP